MIIDFTPNVCINVLFGRAARVCVRVPEAVHRHPRKKPPNRATRGRTTGMHAVATFGYDISHTVTWTFE